MSDLTMKYNPAFLDDETLIRTFVVRHRELATLLEVVGENTGDANQHVLVIGPRGSGKSTLVLRVAAEVRNDGALAAQWYPVVFGEESYFVSNAGEFWLEALLQMADQTGEPRWMKAHADLQGERDADRLGRRALAQLMDFADERGVRLLLVVENLHQLVGSQIDDDAEAWTLRKTLQTEPRLMLLGTATRRFDEIDDQGQALYEFFRIVDLDPLDSLEEIGDLWALADGGDTPRAYMRPVEILTGGNPRLIRILSEFAARTSFEELMDNLVHLMDEHTEYFKHHLDRLAATERKVFVALADRWDPGTAREIAEAARMDVSTTSALLKRLEERGAVRVVDQRGRTKVYQVAERLYNVYYLMRRRGQASARVRAAVRFMVRYYEGERLVPAVHALVQETCALAPERRKDHYLAYTEVLDRADPDVRARIIAETRDQFDALPDVPDELLKLLHDESNPYVSLPLDALCAIDPNGFSDIAALGKLETSLIHRHTSTPTAPVLNALLAVLDRAIEIESDDARMHYNRGSILANLGQYEEALVAFDRAIEIGPDDASMHHNRGVALANLDRYEEALAAFDRAIEIEPNRASTHHNRGVALTDLGRYEEALAAFDRTIEIEPDHLATYYSQSGNLADLGRYEETLQVLSRIVQDPLDWIDVPKLSDIIERLAAGGRTEATLHLLQESPLAPRIEPLLVALHMDLGEIVDVAQEIEEVARDILTSIQARRTDIAFSETAGP